MKAKITFGIWEAIMMLLNTICVPLLLGFPRLMIETGGTAGWIIPIYITVLAVLFFTVIQRLYRNFEGKDIIDIAEIALGRIGRIVTGILLMLYIVFLVTITLREFTEDMKVIALINSPISFVMMFFIAAMVFGCYFGIEPLVRFSSVIVPIIALGFLFIVFGVAGNYDINHLFPILGNGPRAIFIDGFFLVSYFSPLVLLYLIAPFVRTHKIMKITGYTTILLSSIFFTLGTLCYLLVYPYPISIENFLPIYQLARVMEYGRFFQRIESVFVLIWAASAMSMLSIGFYFVVYIFRKTFELDYRRPMIWSFIIIIFTLSLFPPNLMTVLELDKMYYSKVTWIISLCYPILILLIARLRSRNPEKEAKTR